MASLHRRVGALAAVIFACVGEEESSAPQACSGGRDELQFRRASYKLTLFFGAVHDIYLFTSSLVDRRRPSTQHTAFSRGSRHRHVDILTTSGKDKLLSNIWLGWSRHLATHGPDKGAPATESRRTSSSREDSRRTSSSREGRRMLASQKETA